jgi:hypothetical protein
MNRDPLDKLFSAAARAHAPAEETLDSFTQERIVRALRQVEREPSLIPIFRWGFGISMATACAALILNLQINRPSPFEEVQGSVTADVMAYYP